MLCHFAKCLLICGRGSNFHSPAVFCKHTTKMTLAFLNVFFSKVRTDWNIVPVSTV